MRTDAHLLQDFSRTGSDEPFAEIVHRHIGAVYSAALRRVGGDASLAKDVTQAAFIALARKAKVAAEHPFVLAWLYTAVRNEAAHVVRAERRRRVREQQAAELMGHDSPDTETSDWERTAPMLDACIDELGSEDRRAVLMRFMDKSTYPQMAERLHIAEDAARMRVSRALDRLRGLLQRRGVLSTAAALAAALTENAVGAVPSGLAATVVAGASAAGWSAGTGLAATLGAIVLSPLTAVLAVGALAIAAACYEGRQLAVARSQLSARRAELQAAQAAAAAERQQRVRSGSGARPERAAGRAGSAMTDDEGVAMGRKLMARHPELRQAFEAWQDAVTQAKFGPLFQQLHLTADQIHQFDAVYRNGYAYGEAETKLGPITLVKPSQISDSEFTEKLQVLLGTDGYQAYLAYQATLTGRNMAMGFGSMIAESDSPLTTAQALQLASIFSSAGASGSGPAPAFWTSVTSQAETLLSPGQLAQLARFRDLTLARLQASDP